ncbi:MAG: hypothetical protein K2H98_02370, partial [Duncaniella sp.]|nr:hypothetical protein [Duncaniella sp.]
VGRPGSHFTVSGAVSACANLSGPGLRCAKKNPFQNPKGVNIRLCAFYVSSDQNFSQKSAFFAPKTTFFATLPPIFVSLPRQTPRIPAKKQSNFRQNEKIHLRSRSCDHRTFGIRTGQAINFF